MFAADALAFDQATPDYATVRAKRDLEAGEVLGVFEGEVRDAPDRFTLCCGARAHVESPTILHALNHSCDPNIVLRFDHPQQPPAEGQGAVVFPRLITLRFIAKGDEITFDYNSTEWTVSSPFECGCGHAMCPGAVRGFKFLAEEQRERLRRAGIVAPHIEAMALAEFSSA